MRLHGRGSHREIESACLPILTVIGIETETGMTHARPFPFGPLTETNTWRKGDFVIPLTAPRRVAALSRQVPMVGRVGRDMTQGRGDLLLVSEGVVGTGVGTGRRTGTAVQGKGVTMMAAEREVGMDMGHAIGTAIVLVLGNVLLVLAIVIEIEIGIRITGAVELGPAHPLPLATTEEVAAQNEMVRRVVVIEEIPSARVKRSLQNIETRGSCILE